MAPPLHTLYASPAAGFDQPFEMLAGCHDRVRRSLALLTRLASHLEAHGADAAAQSAAADVLRYFDVAAPHHHADEERHLVPLLRAQGAALQQRWAQQLLDEHAALARQWAGVRPSLEAVRQGLWTPGAQALWTAWSERLGGHARWEDEQVYPWAAAHMDTPACQAMGQDMAQRRGAALP